MTNQSSAPNDDQSSSNSGVRFKLSQIDTAPENDVEVSALSIDADVISYLGRFSTRRRSPIIGGGFRAKVGVSPTNSANGVEVPMGDDFFTTDGAKSPHTARSHDLRAGWLAQQATIPQSEHLAVRVKKREAMANIFLPSVTTATVSKEEIDRVKKMHHQISEGARFNFNYLCLLGIASIIAALGLVSDSVTTVISSMLLSPLMGPVIGMSYGLTIWDLTLIRRSFRIEGLSLVICIVFGFITGLVTGLTNLSDDWPNDEMFGRGKIETFWVGIPIAFFSGLGVALSVLDDQTSSLVGVAISASLLPPAVNAGVMWAFSLLLTTGTVSSPEGAEVHNYAVMGSTSLGLTLVNILMVSLAAALMFRIKEVLPIEKKPFWDDLKTARRIYQKRAFVKPGDHVDTSKPAVESIVSP